MGRSVSPGGQLLRSSRMFSLPKPLPEPPAPTLHIGSHKSDTMTKQYPQYQSITSPRSSREKGDWGFKRPFPTKSTMATTTPLIRVKAVDTVENVTDFSSASDHTLSLEKFQELHVAMTIPRATDSRVVRRRHGLKSVFEEETDVTDLGKGQLNEQRWKFRGPWLARMTEGEFADYVKAGVRPRRAEFRAELRRILAEETTTRQKHLAMEQGQDAPPAVDPRHISDVQLTEYLRSLRADRVTMYAIISKFLDLAPLGLPPDIIDALFRSSGPQGTTTESPYGHTGPPRSHPSAGISYLRTNAFMENHALYGPQDRRAPALARVLYPRVGSSPAKLGVGGFVVNTPPGANEFNARYEKRGGITGKNTLKGLAYLDTDTVGGAKAYVEPETANIDASGKVVLKVRETKAEAQLIAKERRGQTQIYNDAPMARRVPEEKRAWRTPGRAAESRLGRVAHEMMEEDSRESPANRQDVMSSSQAYGLEPPPRGGQQ